MRAAIEAARATLFPMSGKPVATANLHLTLAFLGEVDASRHSALLSLAGPLTPCELLFDRVELWNKPRVIVAGCSATPAPMRELVDQLWGCLDRLGFARDPRPFRPHITLARDAGALRNTQRWPALRWRADALRLVESLPAERGRRYEPLC